MINTAYAKFNQSDWNSDQFNDASTISPAWDTGGADRWGCTDRDKTPQPLPLPQIWAAGPTVKVRGACDSGKRKRPILLPNSGNTAFNNGGGRATPCPEVNGKKPFAEFISHAGNPVVLKCSYPNLQSNDLWDLSENDNAIRKIYNKPGSSSPVSIWDQLSEGWCRQSTDRFGAVIHANGKTCSEFYDGPRRDEEILRYCAVNSDKRECACMNTQTLAGKSGYQRCVETPNRPGCVELLAEFNKQPEDMRKRIENSFRSDCIDATTCSDPAVYKPSDFKPCEVNIQQCNQVQNISNVVSAEEITTISQQCNLSIGGSTAAPAAPADTTESASAEKPASPEDDDDDDKTLLYVGGATAATVVISSSFMALLLIAVAGSK